MFDVYLIDDGLFLIAVVIYLMYITQKDNHVKVIITS